MIWLVLLGGCSLGVFHVACVLSGMVGWLDWLDWLIIHARGR